MGDCGIDIAWSALQHGCLRQMCDGRRISDLAADVPQAGLDDGIAYAPLIRFVEHMIVAEDIEISSPREQGTQRSRAAAGNSSVDEKI